jgi:hypothetical protein
VARATAWFGLSLRDAWALTLAEFRLLDRGVRERAAEEYRLRVAAAWHTGVCVGGVWGGKLPPFKKYLDDVAPEPWAVRERRAGEAAKKKTDQAWVIATLAFEAGRTERNKAREAATAA